MAEGTRAGVLVGLVLGAAIGSAGTWLAMARPWRGQPAATSSVSDAGAEPARSERPGKKRRGRGGGGKAKDRSDDAEIPALTAADRAMTWRGAAISLPTRTVDLGAGGDDGRPLESSEIDQVLQRSSGPILACINDAVAGAELSGQLRLELLVGSSGDVQRVRVGAPRWLMSHGVADCATAAARQLRFPATGAPTVVDAPYHID